MSIYCELVIDFIITNNKMQFNYIPLAEEKEEKMTFGNNLKLAIVDKESEWSDCASDETRSTSSYASKSSKREKSD